MKLIPLPQTLVCESITRIYFMPYVFRLSFSHIRLTVYVLDPFKATQLWWAIVKYLKSNITLKRRRYKIKQYDECFSGENAVDVVYRCLCEEKKMHTLITNDITRAVATKVSIL